MRIVIAVVLVIVATNLLLVITGALGYLRRPRPVPAVRLDIPQDQVDIEFDAIVAFDQQRTHDGVDEHYDTLPTQRQPKEDEPC